MLQAMLAGVASIRAQQTRMNVIGNNLANVNTTSFKGSRVTFQDMISQTIKGASAPNANTGGTNPLQFGLGVLVASTDNTMQQGSLSATNRQGDLAIQGNGFFAVTDGVNTYYTRDGSFDIDANGDLVMRSTGLRVLGWQADENGNLNTSDPIGAANGVNIPVGQLTAVQATTNVTLVGNLRANSESTAVWETTVRVYDNLGGSKDITIRFKNPQTPADSSAPDGAISSWDWEALNNDVVLGSSADSGNNPLYFDGAGRIMGLSALSNITVPADGAASAFNIELNFEAMTQLASESSAQIKNQNGYPAGSLQGFTIAGDGTIAGIFTNGLTRALGQIAVAIFPNPGGLERLGNNTWRPSDNSGIASIGVATKGGRGAISAGFLEQSNVDIGQEFTDLIITQRGFQANTKVVTTVDEMLQDLINIKR